MATAQAADDAPRRLDTLAATPSPPTAPSTGTSTGFSVLENGETAAVRFDGLRLKSAVPDPARNEIALTFENAVDGAPFDRLAQALPTWIEFAFSGYDSAVIRAKRAVTFEAQADGDGFIVRIAPAGRSAAAGDGDDARLALQRSRLAHEQGNADEAIAELEELRRRNPDDPDVVRALADAEATSGDPGRAAALYTQALRLRPGDETLAAARTDALRQASSTLGASYDMQDVESGDAQGIARSFARIRLGDGWAVAIAGELRRLEDEEVRTADGSIVAVEDDYAKGEASLIYARRGWETRATVFVADRSVGGGFGLLRRTSVDEAELELAYQEPYYEVVEGIVGGGVRDQVEARYVRNLGNGVTTHVALRLARYGLEGDADLVRTAGFSAGFRYNFGLRHTDLSVGYTVDGEYADRVTTRIDGLGDPYMPLPFEDSEIHAFDLAIAGAVATDLRAEVYGGYAIDRFGSEGPFAGGALIWTPLPAFDLRLDGSYTEVSGRPGESGAATRAGVSVVYRFPPDNAD